MGAVNYLSIIFAALSDVVPCEFRAPSYGVLLAGFYGGFALAPSVAVLVLSTDLAVAMFSLALTASALVLALLFLPETLPDTVREDNLALQQSAQNAPNSKLAWLWHASTRPLREISILNRDWAIRLLTIGSFFSAMVYAADATLVIYYIEETLDFQKSDIAAMTLCLGFAGILIQGGLLQPLIARLGEKGLLIAAYACGTLHNFLYGVARSKATIYAALIASQLTKTNFPILSSMASKDVDSHEQGRVQGALFATNAIGNAIGPLSLEYVYHHTKNKAQFGPGFMFIFASGIYAIGTVIVSLIPVKATEQIDVFQEAPDVERDSEVLRETAALEEPLLSSEERA
jgi:MFS transporter, DHA1 family, tetracycline resistance protein